MYFASVPRVALYFGIFHTFSPPAKFGIGNMHGDAVLFIINADPIAILHQRDRPAFLRFGGDMADDEAVAAAGESAVGDERDRRG